MWLCYIKWHDIFQSYYICYWTFYFAYNLPNEELCWGLKPFVRKKNQTENKKTKLKNTTFSDSKKDWYQGRQTFIHGISIIKKKMCYQFQTQETGSKIW